MTEAIIMNKSKLALLAAALMSTTAMAVPTLDVTGEAQLRTETVKYKATEAATAQGAAALYARLRAAALRVCVDGLAVSGIDTEYQACVAEALTAAVQNVAIPSVSALHQRSGRTAIAAR